MYLHICNYDGIKYCEIMLSRIVNLNDKWLEILSAVRNC